MMRLSDATVEALEEVVRIQGMSGNWDYDEYMHGMYNGMEFMLSIIESRQPSFRNAPEKFLKYAEPPVLMKATCDSDE